LRNFEHAVSLAPDRAEAYAAVGVARLCLGNTSGAADALRRSLALDPNQPQLRSRLAELGG
jgi:Flp pilus assembly protein TadD